MIRREYCAEDGEPHTLQGPPQGHESITGDLRPWAAMLKKGIALRRGTSLLFALSILACNGRESPVEPPSTALRPQFDFGQSQASVLGTTNEGELVHIASNGQVTLIGNAGSNDGIAVGWTGLAFDDAGDLFAMARALLTPFQHLYRVDPETGAWIDEIGPTDNERISDLAFSGGVLYGTSWENSNPFAARLLTIDLETAQTTWVTGPEGVGFNPFEGGPLATGGLAAHPTTGDLWAIEALHTNHPTLYRIDPTTGVADSILRLGLDGVEADLFFDGLTILEDGTFLATVAGGIAPPDSSLYEISSVPDPVSGLAEVAVIPLTYDTPLDGHLNGLASVSATQVPLNLVLNCPSSVERGQTVTCTATDPVNGVGGVTFAWEFDPIPVPVTPNAIEAFFPPPVAENGPQTTATWEGPVVHPGVVTVVGTRAGSAASTANATIAVIDRQVSSLQVIFDPSGINTGRASVLPPGPGDTRMTAGQNHAVPYPGTTPTLTSFFEGGVTAGQINVGPNKGYVFVVSSNFAVRRAYSINPWIEETPGHPYVLGGVPLLTTWQFVAQNHDPTLVLNGVISHEGGPGSPLPSHQSRLNDAALDFPSCGDLQKAVERLTAGSAQLLQDLITDAKRDSFQALSYASGHNFVHGHIPPAARVADWTQTGVLAFQDGLEAGVSPPPATRCDVSNL